MGISNKLKDITERYKAVSTSPSQVWNNGNLKTIARRSGVKLAGAFLLVGTLALAGIGMRAGATETQGPSTPSKQAASSVKLQTSQTNNATASTPASSGNSAGASSPSGTGTNTTSSSTNVTSTSSTSTPGGTTSQVTVNGQPVAVPANGSKTIATPGGQTTVTGSTDDSSVTQTIVSTSNNVSDSGDAMN